MPSDRQQFNVRMTEETAAKVEQLLPAVSKALGVDLSQAQFFALAVMALERQHSATIEAAAKLRGEKSAKPAKPAKPAKLKGKTTKKGK